MTPSLDLSSKPSSAQKSVNTATKVVNLVSASVAMLNEPPKIPKKAPPPELYLGDSSYALRLDEDVMRFADRGELITRLEELPEREIDLVFAGRTALDLSFQIPNGPFKDLRAMIESELAFRSPIQRDQSLWFWSAKETVNGDWLVEGAIVLKTSIDWVLDAMRTAGKTINLARRHNADGSLRLGVEPDWLKRNSRLIDANTWLGRMAQTPKALRLPLIAFCVFTVSVFALFVVQSVRLAEVANQAAAAQAQLTQVAAAQAATKELNDYKGMGEARIAVIGTLAAALPDGVWLEQLLVEDEDITLIGYAPSAAEVTRLLAALPSVSDISFGSPVTRDNTQDLERFRINARLTGLVR